MRKKLALFLAVLISIATVAGCGQEKVPVQNSESQTSTETTSKETEEVRENVTIELTCFHKPEFQDNFNDYVKDSPVYEELVKQTGVELKVTGLATDQANIRMASGDIGDLVMIQKADDLKSLIEADLIVPWNEFVEEYAPNIIEDFPEAWEWSTTVGGKDDQAYCLSVQSGSAGQSAFTSRYLYTVHWDLYKELGYPEITDVDSFLQVMADMQALHPTTEDGKPVYGVSFCLRDTNYTPMVNNIGATYGITSLQNGYIHLDLQTLEVIYDFVDNDKSLLWMATEYYNKAYRLGVLDPDCFTHTEADFVERTSNGEILTGWQSNYYSGYNNSNGKGDGFVLIPVENTMLYQNNTTASGWKTQYGLCLSKDCENPERVAEFLAYTFSVEGSRLLRSGVEGVHWDYVDGVPSYNEETFQLLLNGESTGTGIDELPINTLGGLAAGVKDEDGYTMSLKKDVDYLSRIPLARYEQEYCDYFGVESPVELRENWLAEGKLYDMTVQEKDVILPAATEDIARIDSVCMDIALEAIPKLVMAASDEEYQQIKAETLAKMEAAGAKEAEAFYVNGSK